MASSSRVLSHAAWTSSALGWAKIVREQVAGEVDPAPLVRDALERPPECLDQSGVLVADDEPDAGQAALLEAEQEPTPEDLVLAVTDVQTEDLPLPGGGDPGGDNDGHGHDLPALAGGVTDVEVGRVEVDVGELDVVQRPGAERADGLVEPGADSGDLGLGDPRTAHRFDQVIDVPGRDAVDVDLRHDRVQGLVNPAAGLEDDREERALAELGDPQLDVAGLGGQHPRTVAVAFGCAVIGPLIGRCADAFGRFEIDQLLQRDADRVTDQIDALTGAERLEEFGQGRLGQGHRWTSFGECLAVHTEDPADGRLLHAAPPLALKPHHSTGLSFLLLRVGLDPVTSRLLKLRRRHDLARIPAAVSDRLSPKPAS